MTAASGQYQRVALFMGSDRRLTLADVETLIGAEITVDAYEVQIGRGTVTNVTLLDGGDRLQVTVEQNGRACMCCGHIYDPGRAGLGLKRVGDLRAARPEGAWPVWRWHDLPDWALVCLSDGDCTYRRMDELAADDDGEPETPASFPAVEDLPQGTCRHCGLDIHYAAVLWRHNQTGLIPCADNVLNAAPAV